MRMQQTIRAGHLVALLVLAVAVPTVAFADYPLVFDSAHFEGVEYCQNVLQGPWLPIFSGGTATFATSDECWGMARTRFEFGRDMGVELEVTPHLSSGGTHTDDAHIGFGDGYTHYQGQFVGISLTGGIVYLGTSADLYQQQIGTYTPHATVIVTLFVGADGLLTVSGEGLSGSLDASGILSDRFRFMLDVADSVDGITYGERAIVPTQSESWGTVKASYR